MRISKKILSVFIGLMLIVSQVILTDNRVSAEEYENSGNFTDYNHLYGDSYEEVSGLSLPSDNENSTDAYSINENNTSVDAGICYSISDATEYLRKRMVARDSYVEFTVYNTNGADGMDVYNQIRSKLFEETAFPDEGDYLYWHYRALNGYYRQYDNYIIYYIDLLYFTNAAEEAAVDREVTRLLTTGDLKGLYNANEYTKAVKVYEYLTNNISYDYTYSRYSTYNALINKNVVCQGIATAYYRLCRELGMSVRVIPSEDHGWNIVKIGNLYYNVDATYDLDTNSHKEFFLKGSSNQIFAYYHKRIDEYNTSSFHKAYPMSSSDYNGSTAIVTNVTTPNINVSYSTHVQSYGWQSWVSNGNTSGTSGQSKRLEGICISLSNISGTDVGIRYKTHVQREGWQNWVSNGAMSGTSGQAKRLEAICIELTGTNAALYDVYYRVHAQTYGWLGWAKNGEPAGTSGQSKRLEAIQIVVVKKGSKPDGLIGYSYVEYGKSADNTSTAGSVNYSTHVQSYGWQSYVYDGSVSGTFNESKRLEGIRINLGYTGVSGGITYRTHVQKDGWQNWVSNGAMSGTSGQSKRLEAIEIKLTGQMANEYDIYYRVHAQTYGWLDWAKNGQSAGTSGLSRRLEAIQIVIVPKGNPAPGSTAQPYISK